MLKTLTATALGFVILTGAAATTQAAPASDLVRFAAAVEQDAAAPVHQIGFKKFKHKRFRGHRGHGKFHKKRRFLKRQAFKKRHHGHGVHHDHGHGHGHVYKKKKILTPFGPIIFLK